MSAGWQGLPERRAHITAREPPSGKKFAQTIRNEAAQRVCAAATHSPRCRIQLEQCIRIAVR
jgi:hypothetical protein